MSKVFVSVGMTLDGFIAPEESSGDPPGEDWWDRWMSLQDWMFRQRFFRENLGLGEGGETGPDNAHLEEHSIALACRSWESACSTAGSGNGPRRLLSTRRCSC